MLELYEQNRAMAPSHGNETEGSSASAANHRAPPKASPATEEAPSQNGPHQAAGTSSLQQASSSRPVPDQPHSDKQNGPQRFSQTERNDHDGKDPRNALGDNRVEGGLKDHRHHEPVNVAEGLTNRPAHGSERPIEEPGETTQTRDRSSGHNEGAKSYSPLDAIKKIDKDKVKAALEKRRKERSEVARKMDLMDDDDLIERELESGIELAAEDEKVKQERRHNWSKLSRRQEPQNRDHGVEYGDLGTEKEMDNIAEEGEFQSPEPASRKRKSPGKYPVGKDGYDHQYQYHPPPPKHRDADDSRAIVRLERAEREHKRIRQENHV